VSEHEEGRVIKSVDSFISMRPDASDGAQPIRLVCGEVWKDHRRNPHRCSPSLGYYITITRTFEVEYQLKRF